MIKLINSLGIGRCPLSETEPVRTSFPVRKEPEERWTPSLASRLVGGMSPQQQRVLCVRVTFAAGLWIQDPAFPCSSLVLSAAPAHSQIFLPWGVESNCGTVVQGKKENKNPVSMHMEVVIGGLFRDNSFFSLGWAKNSNCLVWHCLYYMAFLLVSPTGLSILRATPKPKSSLTACLCPTATLCTSVLQVLQVSACNPRREARVCQVLKMCTSSEPKTRSLLAPSWPWFFCSAQKCS